MGEGGGGRWFGSSSVCCQGDDVLKVDEVKQASADFYTKHFCARRVATYADHPAAKYGNGILLSITFPSSGTQHVSNQNDNLLG